MANFKKFTFDESNNVKAMYEIKGSRLKAESTRTTTFETETGTFDSGLIGVVEVTATKIGRGEIEFRVYSDQDGDSRFVETFEIEVVNSSRYSKENYQFDLVDDTVVSAYELGRRGWEAERMDGDESYSVVLIGAETYVLKTDSEWSSTKFDVFVDRDSDGNWTKIAEGETTDAYLTAEGLVDLVGIAGDGLLAPADVVIV